MDRLRVVIGKIIGAHGVGGEVRVRVSEAGSVLESARAAYVGGNRLEVTHARAVGAGRLVVRFRGVTDRDGAVALNGAVIEVDREQLPALADGEFYRCDMIGLCVVLEDGREVGVVRDVIETGANDVYSVETALRREILVPAIADVVLVIDIEARRMTIREMPGLFDE